MKITHTAIAGRPVIDIVTEHSEGPNKGKKYAISYGSTCKHTTSIENYGLSQQEFPLHRIIKDYFHHYGSEEAAKILVGKGIINSENRAIIWLP